MQHTIRTHPLTGLPIVPVGFRRPRPGEVGVQPIWPIVGASGEGEGGEGGAGGGGGGGDDGKGGSGGGGDDTGNAGAGKGEDGKTDAERGYPLKTPESEMTIEQKLAYRTVQMRKHEDAFKKLAGADMTPEKIAGILKAQEDAEEANKTETQRLVDAARKEGEESARAAARTGTVQALIDAHVVSAKLDKSKDADALESLEALNPEKFLAEDGTVDAGKLIKVLNRIAPVGGTSTGRTWPDTGQGHRGNGGGSAKDAGIAEADRRFKTADK